MEVRAGDRVRQNRRGPVTPVSPTETLRGHLHQSRPREGTTRDTIVWCHVLCLGKPEAGFTKEINE